MITAFDAREMDIWPGDTLSRPDHPTVVVARVSQGGLICWHDGQDQFGNRERKWLMIKPKR